MVRPDLHLPPSFLAWLAPFLAVFSRRSRPAAAALTVGALLAIGPRIGSAGRFYDALRTRKEKNPTSHDLRWLSAMVLVKVPFAGRIWALPVLTALTPGKAWSERQRHPVVHSGEADRDRASQVQPTVQLRTRVSQARYGPGRSSSARRAVPPPAPARPAPATAAGAGAAVPCPGRSAAAPSSCR